MNSPQDKKLSEVVKDDEPGKEIETAYDKELKGSMEGRMKPLEKGNLRDSDSGHYGE
jgi:hypothetical protein